MKLKKLCIGHKDQLGKIKEIFYSIGEVQVPLMDINNLLINI